MTDRERLEQLLKGTPEGLSRDQIAARLNLTDRGMRKLVEDAVAESDWPILPPTVTGGVYRLAQPNEHELVNAANAEDRARAMSSLRKARGRLLAFQRRYTAGALFLDHVPDSLEEAAR